MYILEPTSISCRRVTIQNSNKCHSFTGVFNYTNSTYLGRPVYKSDTWPFYLYFYKPNPCTNMWSVGLEVGENKAVAYSYTYEGNSSLEDIASTWTLLVHGNWITDHSMDVKCL